MYHCYYKLLPSSFENLFQTVASIHSYNTRLASKSTYYINTIKTNYGKFNIRFAAVKVWNHLNESIKHLPLKTFEDKVKLHLTVLLFMSFQLVFINLSFYLLILFLFFFLIIINQLLCSSANLPSIFKHYLVLLSSISFLVILSKYYLFLY